MSSVRCVSCGKVQDKEDFYLATDENTGKELGWYCEPCKNKREKGEK